MSTSSTPVVRPRASTLPRYPSTVVAASTDTSDSYMMQQQQFFAPSQLICYVRCCQAGCQNRSRWRSATSLTFRIEELNNDPIFCAGCLLRYPNIPPEQCFPVWPHNTDLISQMYRVVCRESRAHGIQLLPNYITDKEEIISPRSLFVLPLWKPAIFDDSNRRVYTCPECNRSFRKQSRYIRHVSEHINLFQCRHCNQSKARVEDTKNHLIRTCLPRHYPDVSVSHFDGDESNPFHYSRHYRWRTNEEFLNDSRRNYPEHSLGLYPAIVYDFDPAVPQTNFLPSQSTSYDGY